MRLCKKYDVDLIHANILNAHYPIIISRVAHKLNIPLVITVHSWVYLCPSGYNVTLPNLLPCEISTLNIKCIKCVISIAKFISESPLYTATKMLHQTYTLRTLLKEADSIISPSKAFTAKISKRIDTKRYFIPHPVNPRLFDVEPSFEGDGSILYFGRLEYRKGAHLLLPLAKTLNNVNIHVIGRGKLDRLFLENRLPNLFYHGFVTEDEKLKLIRRASVVVVPSIWCEIFAYTVSEAFSLGKPVVAFDLGGPKEQIEASRGGLLATPFEVKDFAVKVKQLLENPSETKRMGLMARKWAEKRLHPDHYAENLIKVYKRATMSCD